MSFAYPLPWWALALVAAAIVLLAALAYARTDAVLTRGRRTALQALRALALAAIVLFLMRPVRVVPAAPGDSGVVAVLVDVSRSMGLADAGETRLARAAAIARDRLAPALGRQYAVQAFTFGERVVRTDLRQLVPEARRSDLEAAVRDVQDRLRGRPLAGIVLVSDGGDTGEASDVSEWDARGVPVMTIGVGASAIARDREVRSVTAGPSGLDASLVDITATLVAHGEGSTTVRLLQGGRVLDVRDVSVPADGSPVPQTFTVAPDRTAPGVYRVEIVDVPGELTVANNAADILVPPPSRPRRVLMIEGAPGFEQSFLKRAWQQDPSLSIDAVVRKGANERGQSTFYVQADPARTAALSGGFPMTREALFAYDAIVFANADLEQLTRDQLDLVSAFVETRGGGVLVLGSRTVESPALDASPIGALLPVSPSDRRGGVVLTAAGTSPERLRVAPTPEGLRHPIMRLAASGPENAKRWAGMPPLAGAALFGAPRPGASVLAYTETATGATVPLVAVQRVARGRTMMFGGEASWRWKMMMPASDRSYDLFWRQALRWLSGDSPDPVSIALPAAVPPGTALTGEIAVRDESFAPVPDAEVDVVIHGPDGSTREAPLTRDTSTDGRFTASWIPEAPGVQRVTVDARRGDKVLGEAEGYVLSGGVDPELVDPRLNERVLQRIASATGGAYVPADRALDVVEGLMARGGASPPPQLRDLWHNAWSLAIVIALLSAEWVLRRRWGLR